MDYTGHYDIRNDGSIVSLKKRYSGRCLKFMKDKDGYLMVKPCIDGVNHTEKVHRLVAKLYVPNPNNHPQVNHIDGNKENNNYWNLEWCTDSHNKFHAYRTGLTNGRRGRKNHQNKRVLQIDNTGKIVAEYTSFTEAQLKTGLSSSYIGVCSKSNYKKGGGYRWKVEKVLKNKKTKTNTCNNSPRNNSVTLHRR